MAVEPLAIRRQSAPKQRHANQCDQDLGDNPHSQVFGAAHSPARHFHPLVKLTKRQAEIMLHCHRMLGPVHRWIWRDAGRRAHKLFRFGETETDGGRDLVRAAELTRDPLLRRLYLVHAADELRHGEMFRRRGTEILLALPQGSKPSFQADWLAPSGHGEDDLNVDGRDDTLLAFLHLSEKAAASRFAVYRDVLQDDPPTRTVFEEILHDEAFHMNYAFSQLARVSP
ncbi:MAG TPA: ferritin-like domain-containing protein, partial [Candidatus Solibacter sp.]|nr:ferritin-like domain-containing protein [Candidatus Solibacter sp.]